MHQITVLVHHNRQLKMLLNHSARFGNLARECTIGKATQKANCVNQTEMTGNLFFANSVIYDVKINGNWYIDSGCSNHMTGSAELLVDIRTNA
ncbi:unnamed protein product [Prunus armeniaca]